MFGDGSGQVVVGNLAGHALKNFEGMNVATDESLETLAVSELQVKPAAMGIHQREGVEFALVARVVERAKVSPIDFEPFARRGLHANEGTLRSQLRA